METDKNKKPEPEIDRKKKKMNWKHPAILSYFRELSIVIIGVFTTLVITNMIGNANRQRDIKGMLIQIRKELQENRAELEQIQGRWEGEQRIFQSLQQQNYELERISADTLSRYNYAVGAIYDGAFNSDSYELLKSSLLIQYVKEKYLLRELMEIYRELGNLYGQLSTYSEQKKSIFLVPMLENMDPAELEMWEKSDPNEIFRFALRERGFRKFISVGQTILSPSSIFEDNKVKLQKTILLMEKSGY